MRSAADIDARLLALLEKLDDGTLSIAEINRRVGAAAEEAGVLRPSYERVRVLVHESRERGWRAGPTLGDVVGDIAYGGKPVTILLDHAIGLDKWDMSLPPERPKSRRK